MGRGASKYAPHHDLIVEYMESGMTQSQIADILMSSGLLDDATNGGLRAYCASHGIPTKVTMGMRCSSDEDLPRCLTCEYVRFFLSADGKGYRRVCMKLEKMISGSVATSPQDCPKRGVTYGEAKKTYTKMLREIMDENTR